MDFTAAFTSEIVSNIANNYDDNFDYYRFGNEVRTKISFIARLHTKLRKWKNGCQPDIASIESGIITFEPYYGYFNRLYYLLNDEASRQLLVKILAHRVLGYNKVKLPTNTSQFWDDISQMENLADKSDCIPINFMNWSLCKFDLRKINLPIELYYRPTGVYYTFIKKQYEYNLHQMHIKAERGDVVIDAGGCFGDTALFFAHEVGESGKVYSFEFVPSNLGILRKNVGLNQDLQPRIQIVPNPLWDESDKNIYFEDNGPGSKVSLESGDNFVGQVKTITIDDFVERNDIGKIDFIKMDIEGCEYNALRGARKVLSAFKPKLAISLYHKPQDFGEIPHFLDSLNLGYKFFLGHYTIHQEETVLFCIAG